MLSTPMYSASGLGNQLSNYVTVRTLALDKGFEFGVQFPERFKGLSFMNLDMGLPVLNGVTEVEGDTPKTLPDGFTAYYREKMINSGDYDPDIFNVEDNTLIHGNLQGIEYYKHRRKEIQEWLKVEPLELPENLCIINFRGGEYKYVKDFFLPIHYWLEAIRIMREINNDMQFEIHTDDPEEARKFFPDFKIVKDIEINWRTLRYCHYAILSNSSFAILPIFLNDNVKEVIAPWGFGRYNTGEWLLRQNYNPQWTWLNRLGELCYTL